MGSLESDELLPAEDHSAHLKQELINSRQERIFYTPEDKFQLTYVSFLLVGCGLLFPWNTVLSAVDFWNDEYPDIDLEFYFPIFYQFPNLIGLIVIVLYGNRFSFRQRIVPGFILYLIGMAILPFVGHPAAALAVVAVLGFTDCLIQGSLFALAGMFSPKYVAATMSGLGVAGFSVSILRVGSKAAFPSTSSGIHTATYIFFGLSCFVIVLCVIAYLFVLERSPVTKHYLDRPARERNAAFERILLEKEPSMYATLTHDFVVRDDSSALVSGGALPMAPDERMRMEAREQGETFGELIRKNIEIGKKIWHLAGSTFLIFWVTLSLFPGITSEMTSTDKHLNFSDPKTNPDGTGWFVVIMIAVFNFGDLVGRSLPNWPQFIIMGERGVVISSILRLVFFPLFIMCVKHVGFGADPWQYIIMLLFSLSNGYVSTLAMMYAPECVALHQKEQAGTLMVFCLTIGLTTGVFSGLAIKSLVDNAF